MSGQESTSWFRGWKLACGSAALVLAVLIVLLTVAPVFRRAKEVGRVPAEFQQRQAEGVLSPGKAAPAPAAETAAEGVEGMKAATVGGPLTGIAQAAEARREIIYTAEMTIEVDDVDAALDEVKHAVQAAGGWLHGRNVYVGDTGDKTATVTVRVPSAKFDEFLERLRSLGDLRSENTRAEDVTRQMVDLEARLRNLRREEEVIAELFKRQGKITDVLQVEKELARVREQIEQGEGELNYLRENVAYSTITVTINTKPSKIEQKLREWSPGYHVLRAWRSLVKVVRALVTALIYLVIVGGPFIVAALVIWWAVRYRRRAKASAGEG